MDKIEKLQELIDNSNKIVFFGGAGVSTESGIPDFRSKDGLYNQKYKYPPEMILSHTFFMNNTEEFYKFYKDKMNCIKYEPNITHKILAKLEEKNKLIGIITQNIDGLHQKAGSKKVYELHGTVYKNYCTKCGKKYDEKIVFNSSEIIPICTCGGVIKPEVVLYEEPLNENTVLQAEKALKEADLLIIAGTSLTVYPAAGMIYLFKGKNIVLINKDLPKQIENCDLVINKPLGEVFSNLKI